MILMSIILKRNRNRYIYITKGKERIREKKRDIIITTYLLPPSPIPPKKTNIEVILCDLFALYKRITRIKD